MAQPIPPLPPELAWRQEATMTERLIRWSNQLHRFADWLESQADRWEVAADIARIRWQERARSARG